MRAQTNSYRYLPKYTRVLLQSNSTKGNPTRICGFSDEDIVRYNKAISSHMRNGQCHSALQLFDQMPKRTTVSWNAMISGYLSNDKFNLARKFFDDMPERDLHSYNIMINGYVRNRNLNSARDLFNKMPQRDAVSWNTMISAYAQNGYVDQAREVFDKMPNKNSISWNGILAAYIQNGRIECAFQLFQSKLEWDIVSWNAMIAGFLRRKRLIDARRLFEMIPEKDTVSWNTMISGYAQNGQLLEAKEFFDNALVRDVFTWTAMISGYVQNGMLDEARDLFDKMPEKNSVSWNAMMAGYLQHRRIDEAEQLFKTMPCRNISSWNTMITAYAQNGAIDRAQHLFDKMPCRDSISWAAMIAGYTQGGYSEEALRLFIHMKRECELVTRSAFTCSLSTCADLAALECGRQLHGCLVKTGYETGCYVGNALLSMYCKCGNIDDAYNAFNRMPEKDIVTWNTMIAGYARHGFGVEALEVFETMGKLGIKPDDVTMVGVLSACSHAGLVDKGTEFFNTMTEFYGIPVREQHYTCMIDLLGRAGRLKDAQNLMKNMPFEADATMWGALLGASRIHRNATLGEVAAKRIFELEPENSGMYVLLSNLYASSGRWNDVNKMRILMKERGVKKVPGCSWIEVKNTIHAFSVGDFEHPAKEKIYQLLDELDLKMKKEGYISSLDMVLHDVEEEEKEHMLRYHSEKLAVAFGILNVPSGRPIRVIKNLRVCEDCHNAIKYISKIVGRLIILRDSNRFHHFENGLCSCGDYW